MLLVEKDTKKNIFNFFLKSTKLSVKIVLNKLNAFYIE